MPDKTQVLTFRLMPSETNQGRQNYDSKGKSDSASRTGIQLRPGGADGHGRRDPENRAQVNAADKEIVTAFREKFGAVRCADLKAAKIACDDVIAFAAEKAEELLK